MEKFQKTVVKFKLKKRQPFFTCFKGIIKLFLKKPKVINLNDKIEEKSILIANHCNIRGPWLYELYLPKKHALWGAHEMLGNYSSRKKYLRDVFYIQKQGYSRRKASFIATIFAVFSPMLYKGMRVLPTFQNARLKETVKRSLDIINNNVPVMIFPEDSSKGYFETLTALLPGFVTLSDAYYKKTGIDLPVYPIYYSTQKKVMIIGKPCYVQEYVSQGLNRKQIAEIYLSKINELNDLIKEKY